MSRANQPGFLVFGYRSRSPRRFAWVVSYQSCGVILDLIDPKAGLDRRGRLSLREPLLVTQALHWIQLGGARGWNCAEKNPHQRRHHDGHDCG